MNKWTQLSIDLANQQNYLDLLFRIYPIIPEDCREIDQIVWSDVKQAFLQQNNQQMIQALLKLDLFPVKDSYVAYLKHDPEAVSRNPQTVNRLAGRIYDLGINRLFERCSEPKETNRQIGPLFKNWVNSGALGIFPVPLEIFEQSTDNAILAGSDEILKSYACQHLGYKRMKGLDFLGRFNGKYVIGEAKFLSDFGGHQNAQFADALSTVESPCNAVRIAIFDGVCYIPGKHKMYSGITQRDVPVMSALVLRDFLYQV